MEYQVRAARITDIDRLVALAEGELRSDDGEAPLVAADLLRQLVYLPQASVFVVDGRRGLAGGAVLALRPSVRAGGFIGSVDFLAVDPEADAGGITRALLEEILRSAGNKGCSLVEAPRPEDPEIRDRWSRMGFRDAGPHIEHSVATVRATVGRS